MKRVRSDEQEQHMRRRLEVSWHKTTKPRDLMATVNDAAVQRKFMFLLVDRKWGDLLNRRSVINHSKALVYKCLGFSASSTEKSEPDENR